jgi:hypothetical protein
MTAAEINNRIELLRDVYAYSLTQRNVLSVGQRICLTQERTAQMTCLEQLKQHKISIQPRYVLPAHLEIKVQEISKFIIETNWVKPVYEPF